MNNQQKCCEHHIDKMKEWPCKCKCHQPQKEERHVYMTPEGKPFILEVSAPQKEEKCACRGHMQHKHHTERICHTAKVERECEKCFPPNDKAAHKDGSLHERQLSDRIFLEINRIGTAAHRGELNPETHHQRIMSFIRDLLQRERESAYRKGIVENCIALDKEMIAALKAAKVGDPLKDLMDERLKEGAAQERKRILEIVEGTPKLFPDDGNGDDDAHNKGYNTALSDLKAKLEDKSTS